MEDIKQITEKLMQSIGKIGLSREPRGLYEPIEYILSLGGKRIRPLVTLLASEMFGGNPYDAMPQALAIEVFHNFTLLHDDIMDEAPLRRNQETVHLKWDVNTGILSGDAMLIKAYQFLSATPPLYLSEILTLFNDTAMGVCEGQQMDMEFENRDDVTIDEYIEMIRLKTAVLLACSLKTGAIIGGANDEDAQKLYDLGEKIGLSFQLQDDILDTYGTAKVGKRKGGDIISNKKTFLLISAKERATGALKEELEGWIAATDFDESEKVEAVIRIFDELGIRDLASAEMKRYSDEAYALMDSIDVPEESKSNLLKIMESLVQRDH